MVDYRTWARLNVLGKQEWGKIFYDGKVPILSISFQKARLEGIKDAESVFTVNWTALTQRQQQAILEKLSKQTGASKDAIFREVLGVGLPLRRKWVQSIGTSQIELHSKNNS